MTPNSSRDPDSLAGEINWAEVGAGDPEEVAWLLESAHWFEEAAWDEGQFDASKDYVRAGLEFLAETLSDAVGAMTRRDWSGPRGDRVTAADMDSLDILEDEWSSALARIATRELLFARRCRESIEGLGRDGEVSTRLAALRDPILRARWEKAERTGLRDAFFIGESDLPPGDIAGSGARHEEDHKKSKQKAKKKTGKQEDKKKRDKSRKRTDKSGRQSKRKGKKGGSDAPLPEMSIARSINIPSDVRESLRAEASARGISVSALIRQVMEDYVGGSFVVPDKTGSQIVSTSVWVPLNLWSKFTRRSGRANHSTQWILRAWLRERGIAEE